MIKVEGKGKISATIIADSVSSVTGKRITTYELEYPRFIHAEFMTHRLFSRNAASSRAIPVKKLLALIRDQPAMPVHWGKNQPGMSAKEECDSTLTLEKFDSFDCPTDDLFELVDIEYTRQEAWGEAASSVSEIAEAFDKAGYHKQIVNRLLEPFQFIKVVVTATEYDNFFWLRNHPDAQPEIQVLAECMWEAQQQSAPVTLKSGEWHVPYYEGNYGNGVWKPSGYATSGDLIEVDSKRGGHTLAEALQISSSCCAQVSYRLLDQTLEKAAKIYDMLVNSKPVHASPFEHQATPIADSMWNGPWPEGVTHLDRNGSMWSGNLKDWIQHRQLIPENACWGYEPASV